MQNFETGSIEKIEFGNLWPCRDSQCAVVLGPMDVFADEPKTVAQMYAEDERCCAICGTCRSRIDLWDFLTLIAQRERRQPPSPPPPPASPPPALPSPGIDDLCKTHRPPKRRRGNLEYWYFNAVSEGCKSCVKILVKDMGVNKYATSETQNYNAMNFAEYYNQQEMKEYLRTL